MVISLNKIWDIATKYFDSMKWVFAGCFAVLLLILIVVLVLRKKKESSACAVNASVAPSVPMDNGTFAIEIGNLQGTGEREEQQDAFAFSPSSKWKDKGFLAVLADGMGGMDAGAAISNKLVHDIISEFPYSFEKQPIGTLKV